MARISFLIFYTIVVSAAYCQQKTLTVSQDGRSMYQTVQAAFNAVPRHNKKPVTIYIKNGVYREKLFLDSTKLFVTVVGEDPFKTIVSFDDHTGKISTQGDTINTRTSWTFKILADNF